MIRVGFTGTQRGMTDAQKARVDIILADLEHDAVEFHHGDCIGADEEAHDLADNHSFDLVIHPPDNDSKRAFCTGGEVRGTRPYLQRNRDIVDEVDILIACPGQANELIRSGTWSTVRWARTRLYSHESIGPKTIYIISPSGETRREGR